MLGLCRGSAALNVINAAPPSSNDMLPDLPSTESQHKRARDLHRQLSIAQPPVAAPREIAIINLECVESASGQQGMPTLHENADNQDVHSTGGNSNWEDGGAPGERGFVRVRSIRCPPGARKKPRHTACAHVPISRSCVWGPCMHAHTRAVPHCARVRVTLSLCKCACIACIHI